MKSTNALGVTGTPCTGKKTISPLLASMLGMACLDINAVAMRTLATGEMKRRRKLGEERTIQPPHTPRSNSRGTLEVDPGKVRSALLRTGIADTILFGHLLPSVLRAGELEFVAVLRCEPTTLKRRLIARGYEAEKVIENVEAELIGVVLDEAIRTFGGDCIHEYDTTRAGEAHPALLARRIAEEYRAKSRQSKPWIDWTLDYDDSTRLRSLLSASGGTEPAST